MTRFITILSGKGGVGKTTVSINLGAAFKKIGKDVIVLDADLTTPDVGLYFGVSNFPVTLTHVFNGSNELAESMYLHPEGFKIMPAGIDNSELKHINADFNKVFKKLQGLSEIVVIDSPSGLGKDVQSLLQLSDEAVVVTNPDVISVANALKTIKLAEENNATVLGVVLNRIKRNDYEMDISSIESMLSLTIIAEIDEDEIITKARTEKKSLVFNYPGDAADSFKILAAKLAGENYDIKGGDYDETKNYSNS